VRAVYAAKMRPLKGVPEPARQTLCYFDTHPKKKGLWGLIATGTRDLGTTNFLLCVV
jgi:hypothetical protein